MSIHSEFPTQLLEELSMDDVYDLLSDQLRRQTLLTLHDEGKPKQLQPLALSLAGVQEPTRTAERLHARLYHTHIPKLEQYGLVRYYDDADLIEITERGDLLAATIDQ